MNAPLSQYLRRSIKTATQKCSDIPEMMKNNLSLALIWIKGCNLPSWEIISKQNLVWMHNTIDCSFNELKEFFNTVRYKSS
jgi:hypothetical protein